MGVGGTPIGKHNKNSQPWLPVGICRPRLCLTPSINPRRISRKLLLHPLHNSYISLHLGPGKEHPDAFALRRALKLVEADGVCQLRQLRTNP